MAIKENDILSGRPLVMSFPDGSQFEDGITIFNSDKYSVYVGEEDDALTITLRDVDDEVIATFYSYDVDTQTTTINLSTYTLPDDFGVVYAVETESDAYQYITAIMGTPLASDTLDMSTYGKASKVATNYMKWSSEYGLVISEDATEDPEDMTGGNTRISYEGMEVYKGHNRVAKFGEETIIGDEEGANAYLDPDTFKITNADGIDFFSVDMDGDPEETYKILSTGKQRGSGSITTTLSETDDFAEAIPDGNDVIVTFGFTIAYEYYTGSVTVVKGTAKTEQITVENTSGTVSALVTISYDGDGNYTASCTFSFSGNAVYYLEIKGIIETPAPSYTLGTRIDSAGGGAYSSTLGKGLTANEQYQVAIGSYNEPVDDAALIIGRGVDENRPLNALTVDWYGNIWHYGDGYKTATISKLSGANIADSGVLKYGKMVMLYISFTGGSYSSGDTIFEGTLISSGYLPGYYCTASAFYGSRAIVGRIKADGSILIRNTSTSSMSLASDTLDITFTYITA